MNRLFSIVALLMVANVYANPHTERIEQLHDHIMSQIAATRSAAKTTTLDYRLKGRSRHQYNGTFLRPVDSIANGYSHDRGYDFQLDEWQYDYCAMLTWNNTAYALSSETYSTIDTVTGLTMEKDITYTSSALSKMTYTYNNGKITQVLRSSFDQLSQTYLPDQKTVYTYNGNGQCTSITNSIYNTGWTPQDRTNISYDANGLPQVYIFQYYSSGWTNGDRTTKTYANGRVAFSTIEVWNSGQWVNNNRDSMTYNAAGELIEKTIQAWSSAYWFNASGVTYTYDANHNCVSELKQTVTGMNQDFNTYTYNSGGRVIHAEKKQWMGNQWGYAYMQDDSVNYYYEQFNNAVSEPELNEAALVVFPVPSKNILNVKVSLPHSAAFALSVYDIAGRELIHKECAATTQYAATLDIAELPAGTYIIKLGSELGGISKVFSKTE